MKYFKQEIRASTPWREWRGLTCAFVWFFCSMYSYYDPFFEGNFTVFYFMALLCVALAATTLLWEKKPDWMNGTLLLTTPLGALCSALIPFVPTNLSTALFFSTAIWMAPLLCRRLYGILIITRPNVRTRMYISTVSVTIVLQMIWVLLPLPFEIKFPILSVFALLGFLGGFDHLPLRNREPWINVKPRSSVRLLQIISAIVLLFALNIFNTLIHTHIVMGSLENNDVFMLVIWAVVPIAFFVFAIFTDVGKERLGFIVAMAFILMGCFLALMPNESVFTAPLLLMDEFGGTITEFYFLTMTLIFFPTTRRPLLVAVSGLIIHTISSAMLWIQQLWLPEFLLNEQVNRPLVIFGAVCVLLLTPLVFSVWERHRDQTLMAALLGIKQKDEEKIKAAPLRTQGTLESVGIQGQIDSLDWIRSLDLIEREYRVALLLCEGQTREEITQELGLTFAQVSELLRSIRTKLSVLPPIGRSRAAGRAVERYGLTQREAEVFDELLLGRSNVEIASNLFIVEATVKFHVRNILKKAGVQNRTQLIAKMTDIES